MSAPTPHRLIAVKAALACGALAFVGVCTRSSRPTFNTPSVHEPSDAHLRVGSSPLALRLGARLGAPRNFSLNICPQKMPDSQGIEREFVCPGGTVPMFWPHQYWCVARAAHAPARCLRHLMTAPPSASRCVLRCFPLRFPDPADSSHCAQACSEPGMSNRFTFSWGQTGVFMPGYCCSAGFNRYLFDRREGQRYIDRRGYKQVTVQIFTSGPFPSRS